MAVLPTGIGPVTGGYQIERSLRFNSADSAYLNRTFGTATNQKIWTWSGWVKRSSLTSAQMLFGSTYSTGGNQRGWISFGAQSSTDQLEIELGDTGNTTDYNFLSNAVYRDVGAWAHILIACDLTQATDTNRLKAYVNGVQVTFASATYPAQNSTVTVINRADIHTIGGRTSDRYFNGYMTEINFIDGQALTPSSFGETDSATGVWKPKAYSGTYGTNGFYLKFADNSGTTSTTLGKDSSGNGNNWTPNNFSVTAGVGNDSLVDSPTSYGTDTGVGGEVRGNYATFNPLFRHPSTTWVTTYSEGNLKSSTSNAGSSGAISNIAPTSGKWYCEITCTAVGSATPFVDISTTNSPDQMNTSGEYLPGNYSYGVYYNSAGTRRTNNTATASWGSTWTTNDVLMLAGDCDTGKVWFGKNGTWQASGNPASGTNQAATLTTATPMWFGCGAVSGAAFVANFGQRPFAYTAPSGFKALCTQNLPTPTIGATSTTQAGKYFNPVLWTSTGSAQSVTGVGFQPDLVWMKSRNYVFNPWLFDAVRGTGNLLASSTTDAEASFPSILSAFNSDGFTTNSNGINGYNFVAWAWKANGAGSTNTAGTITSTVSANTTSGFSIISYTGNKTSGATIGHGIGVAPSMVIFKERANASEWIIYHQSLGATQSIYFSTAAANTNSIWFNNTAPSSTVITLGNADGTNRANTMIAYAFAPVAGYSAFGSYTGNGSADGPFVYTGFRPRWLFWKRSNSTGSWGVYDTARSTYNQVRDGLLIESSGAEFTYDAFDILSNGFKVRAAGAGTNGNGDTHIFGAFAENPFKYSLAR